MQNKDKQPFKEELQRMYNLYCNSHSNESVGESENNSIDSDKFYRVSVGCTDSELDDYYANLDEDDRDCSYYENAYGNLVDLAERQAEPPMEEDDIYEQEDYYSEMPFLEPIETKLQKAKKCRACKQYKKALDLCDSLLKENPNNRYVLNLKLATLGDMGSPEAYKLAINYIQKYAWKKDFVFTMLGLLHKMNYRKDIFVESLNKYCPVCLEIYLESLEQDSPKKRYLLEMMKKKEQPDTPEGD